MATNSDYYLARAEDSAREAREAKLDNVRERCLRSEAAWRAMAARLMRIDDDRARQAADKAARETIVSE